MEGKPTALEPSWASASNLEWEEYANLVKRSIEARLEQVNTIIQEIRQARAAIEKKGERRHERVMLLYQCLEKRSLVLD